MDVVRVGIVGTGGMGSHHARKWIDAIRTGTPLVAPGEEGIRSLGISNAILLSAWTDAWVDIPVDEDLFYEKLQERVATSTCRKTGAGKTMSVDGTF